MKYIKRFIFYLVVVIIHFLFQTTMMLLSVISKFIFHDASRWSAGNLLALISTATYKVLTFPIVWLCEKFSFSFPWFEDLPFVINSLLWGLIIFLVIISREKNKYNSRYYFRRGV